MEMRAFSLGSDAQDKKILVIIKEEVIDQITYMSPKRNSETSSKTLPTDISADYFVLDVFFPECTSTNVPGFGPKRAKQMM